MQKSITGKLRLRVELGLPIDEKKAKLTEVRKAIEENYYLHGNYITLKQNWSLLIQLMEEVVIEAFLRNQIILIDTKLTK